MRFGPVPLQQAAGKILGHNIAAADGRRALRKGRPLSATDIKTLHQLGRSVVYVAELEPGDVDEDAAALRVATAASGGAPAGAGLRLSGPATGRVNLLATRFGVLRVGSERLARLNSCPGITLATLPGQTVVGADRNRRRVVATVKVLPYAVAAAVVERAEAIAAGELPLLHVDPLPARQVVLILSGSPPARERVVGGFEPPLRGRIEALGSTLHAVDFVPLDEEQDEEALAQRVLAHIEAGAGLILLAGETAIMDRYDIAPRAIDRAGGEVTAYGAPVDPGNLLMLAYVGETPVMGAPGCARSPKPNIVDQLLPRLLAGDRLSQTDIAALGDGGLLEDVPERPVPRSRIGIAADASG